MTTKMKNKGIREICRTAVSAALIAISAWITVPAAVPFTLQSLAVALLAGLFGGKKSAVAVGIYILVGILGLPVFSGGRAGVGVLFGETGGYIFGFLGMAFVCGGICGKNEKSTAVLFLAMLSGLVFCYSFGTVWAVLLGFGKATGEGFFAVLSRYVFPFLVPDLLKTVLAVFLVKALRRRGFR